jgi:hypothetical protein
MSRFQGKRGSRTASIGAAFLLAALLLILSSPGAVAQGTPPNGVPGTDNGERNNVGELSHWHHGNTVGRALLQYGDLLAVGGGFTHAGATESPGAAFWTGTGWIENGEDHFNNWVYCFEILDDALFAGGHFTHVGANELPYIARLESVDTGAWTPLSGGSLNHDVWALRAFTENEQTYLVAGGGFTEAGTTPVNSVARWNGTTWSAMGDGFNGVVYALYVFDGELYAGGSFTHSGATEVNYFALWNGSSWEAVSGGFDAPVMAIGEYDGELVVGGHFLQSGDGLAFHIAHFDGVEWQGYGWGTNGAVFAIHNFNDTMVVGGEFNEAGGIDCSYLAQWNGYDWLPLGPGVDDNRVFGLCSYDGLLVATGGFITSHDVTVNRITYWDAPHWEPFGGGLTGSFVAPSTKATDEDGPISLGGPTVTPGAQVDTSMPRLAVRGEADGFYTVFFELPTAASISLTVLDVSGRLVSQVAGGFMDAGEHTLQWNPGSSELHRGVYFMTLSGANIDGSARVVVLK